MSIEAYPSPNGVLTSLIWRKTATGGETSLSGYDNASQALSYTPGQEQVYLNGILLVRGSDYTATNGTSITNLAALAADDFIQVNCYNNFSLATLPATSITGEISESNIPASIATTQYVTTALTSKISNSLTTTTGDMIYASSANTPARIGIGSTNQVLTVSGGVPTWVTPSGGSFTGVSVYGTGVNIDVPNNTVVTITFNSELFDTNGFHSTSVDTSKLTVPSGKAGYYWIFGDLQYAASTANKYNAQIAVNGNTIAAQAQGSAGGDFNTSVPIYTVQYLAVGDYVELKARQITGGSINAKLGNQNETTFGMYLLGA